MQVSKWGNSLAVRFPAALVQALDLKEGKEIDLHLVGVRTFEVEKNCRSMNCLHACNSSAANYPQISILIGLKPTREKS